MPTGAREQGRRAVGFLYPLEFLIEQVKCFIPGDAHEPVVAALRGVAQMALAHPVNPHHRITNTCGTVNVIGQARNHLRGILIHLERLGGDKAPVHHRGADGPPV
ncbi:hypothetical protein D3C77_587350 [compost metagenome]